MSLVYYFQQENQWHDTAVLETIPKDVTAVGVGLPPVGTPLVMLHADPGVGLFLEESTIGAVLGWKDGPFNVFCHLVGTSLWLATVRVRELPVCSWEPPIVHWRPHYSNGDSPIMQRYEDIDRSRLRAFSLTDVKGNPALMVLLAPGQRLIYRRRVFLSSGGRRIFHLCGFQQRIGGRNYQAICYVPESGGTLQLAGRFRKDHPLFYSVSTRSEEQ